MIYQSPYTRDLGVNTCADCFEKQLEIDRLRVEVKRLKGLLHYRRQAAVAAPFGSSTPSSKILVKPNTPAEETIKHGGAHVGHAGHGRRAVKASEVPCIRRVRVAETACPQCGKQLITKGWCERSVLEMPPVVVEPVLYRLQKAYCAGCRHSVTARAPGVLAHTLFSNQLSAHILTSHYLHGEPLGRISERLGLKVGSLIGMAHRVAGLFQGVVKHLSDEYRRSPVRHADETGWRTDGQNGYAWLFSTASLSIFLFRRTRSSSVAKEILGTHPLNGVLVVDRYHAYNRAPVALQYCYVHLLRETQDLGSEFPDDTEVQAFTSAFAPLLVRAIALRTKQLREVEHRQQALEIVRAMNRIIRSPARHTGIRRLQDIFHHKARRLFHWTRSPDIPADNNRAERELRPTVIARKTSFGSQSEAGANTREILTTLLATLKKRVANPQAKLKSVLDELARDRRQDAMKLLWATDST